MKHIITIFSNSDDASMLAECSCGLSWGGELNPTIEDAKNHIYQNRLLFLKEEKKRLT